MDTGSGVDPGRKSVRQKFLQLMRALIAVVGEREDERRRQVLLNRCLPVVQVADVEIRIDGVSLRRSGNRRRQKGIGQRVRVRSAEFACVTL